MPADDRPSNDSEAPAMTTTTRRCTASLLGLLLVFGASSSARAAAPPSPAGAGAAAHAPDDVPRKRSRPSTDAVNRRAVIVMAEASVALDAR